MRQWNHVKAVPCAHAPEFAANNFLQFCALDELHDSQSTDWNDEPRSQDSDLIVHP